MKRLPIALAVAALLSSPLAMAKTVEAVASFSILGDIVQQVGGSMSMSSLWLEQMVIPMVLSRHRKIAGNYLKRMWCLSVG